MESPREVNRSTLTVRLTIQVAARQYGVSVARLRSAVRARRLRLIRTGHQEWVTAADMDRLLALESQALARAS